MKGAGAPGPFSFPQNPPNESGRRLRGLVGVVRVDVRREGGRGMAELPGHHVETGTGSKREHGVAVPGVVKGDRRDAGRCYQSAPPAEQRVGVNHGSVRLGDHPRKDDSKPAVGAPGRPARRDAFDKAEQQP
jgi:hypothetical protein